MQIGVSTWEAGGSLSIRLENFGTKPLKSQQHKIRMVADAVLVEPVSTPKFPASREKNKEGFNFGPNRGSEVVIRPVIWRP